jgi:cob(I)alamin adenosyltransferase
MSIYTKTGDKGETSLIGGKRVPKSDVHLDIYGTLDELSSFIGLLKQSTNEPTREYLTQIQETLIQINALYANDNEDWDKNHPFNCTLTEQIEQQIDQINQTLPLIHCFIVPGSSSINALCNVCRCICRRAERNIHKLSLLENQAKASIYINRLSDYFFILGRKYE